MDAIDRASNLFENLGMGARIALDLPMLLPKGRFNPAAVLDRWVRRAPDDLALAYLDERYTWRELNENVDRYAGWFSQQGIGPGDVVALIMDNRPDYLSIVTGLNRIGAISSLINTNLTGNALVHGIGVCDARKVLVGAEHLDRVTQVLDELQGIDADRDLWVQVENGREPPPSVRAINAEVEAVEPGSLENDYVPSNNDIYCYIYTSGTTGLPKAAIIRNRRMLAASVMMARLMHRTGPGDVIYVPLPLYHSSAMFVGWGSALTTGACMAFRRKFSVSEFWDDVRKFRASNFVYIGELCRYLLNAEPTPGDRDHSLRVGVGNGMDPAIWETFQERFGIPMIREFYGATEGNTPLANFQGRPRMVGKMTRGQALLRCDLATGEVTRNAEGFCEPVKAGEIGLLVGRISPMLTFDGYVDASATEKKIMRDVFKKGDRYFDTGDLLHLHDDSWLSFADRVGDTFRWKGENVSTTEVSGTLAEAAGILEANVYGVKVPHAEGRAGMAAIAVDDNFDLDAFATFVGERLPGYQRPRFLRLLGGEMRITGTLKHQKVDYRKEGFDPRKIEDPLFVLERDTYVPVDEKRYAQVESGEVRIT